MDGYLLRWRLFFVTVFVMSVTVFMIFKALNLDPGLAATVQVILAAGILGLPQMKVEPKIVKKKRPKKKKKKK